MSNEQRYRVVIPEYGAPGNRRQEGETFVPTDAEIQAFGGIKLEPVEDEDEDGDVDGVTESTSSDEETDDGYKTYPREDLEAKEYGELRELAMESDNDDVNGRSSGDEIIESLAEN